jgi:hypothetical protein
MSGESLTERVARALDPWAWDDTVSPSRADQQQWARAMVRDRARTLLAVVADDVDGIAGVLRDHDSDRMSCADHDGLCCPAGDAHGYASRHAHQAAMVAAYLRGDA